MKNSSKDKRFTMRKAVVQEAAIGLISSNSDKREWSDVVNCDKGIAIAMAEEPNTTDGRSQLSELDEIKPIAQEALEKGIKPTARRFDMSKNRVLV